MERLTREWPADVGPAGPRRWSGELPVAHRYTAGVAGERFLREIKERGRLLAAWCPECRVWLAPPQLYCERCFAELTEWAALSGRGTLLTWTRVWADLEGRPLAEPVCLGLVRLELAPPEPAGAAAAAPGSAAPVVVEGGLLHYLGELGPDEPRVGQAVEAVFRPAAERVGSILDLEHFRPVRG